MHEELTHAGIVPNASLISTKENGRASDGVAAPRQERRQVSLTARTNHIPPTKALVRYPKTLHGL
jgi:hypothetical protein